jgi:predicted Zn-dependent protease
MKLLRAIFSWIFLIVSLFLFYHVYSIRYVACETPIEYTVGDIDPRFNVSKTDLQGLLESASKVWETPLHKDLFVNKTEGKSKNIIDEFLKTYIDKYYTRTPVVVNLIYDERQQISNQNRLLAGKIDDTKDSADAIKSQFLNLQEEYRQAKREYESMLQNYRNGVGNRKAMQDKVDEINRLVNEINALVKKYNYLIKEVNTNIELINQNTGEFEEGEYVADRTGERINIYEFENRQVLLRVLTHELGHALGMDHNDNPQSIMYYLNKSTSLEPTKEDLSDLNQICKSK